MANTELRAISVDSIEGKFFVPSYQRGYRWGTDEVTRLLDDVYNLRDKNVSTSNVMKNAKDYCLQPIVVKKLGEKNFEVIDGQQRLTTLFIIYTYMGAQPNFSLSYETRNKSQDFLENIESQLNRRKENIDFWFMANAYETVKNWFEKKIKSDSGNTMRRLRKDFETLFTYNVQVIWYEVEATEDEATALFARLNIGKIPLTNSELVKAMFLSRRNEQMDERKQNELAFQWDSLEKELHDDSLWYFLTNYGSEKYQTRIDLILDLISEKKSGEKDDYYTFFYFDSLRERENLEDVWQKKIFQTFLLLKDWRENHDFYHKIGYLIASGTKNLLTIYQASKGKTKTAFLKKLEDFIKDSVKLDDDEHYSDWNYENAAGRIFKLLLLFNVESVRQKEQEPQWFSFDKFKSFGKEKSLWSLEHIHAINSRRGDQSHWKEWLTLHRESLELLPENNSALIKEIDELLAQKRLSYGEFSPVQEKVIKKFSSVGDSEEIINSIANLAIIKCKANSALGNSTFDVKRNFVVKMDMNGEFIPYCTKMVFLKYYTRSEENQIHFWSQIDREAYIAAINGVLGNYLSEQIKMIAGEV